jgi:hypothetical protein
MFRPVVILAAFLAATPALAQPAPAAGLFISPAGEPFRAEPGQPYPLPTWFSGADADQDGAISPSEFDRDALRFFDVLDTNRDGKITSPETRAYETEVAPEIVRKIPLLSDRASGRPSDAMRTLPPPNGGATRLRPPNEGAGFYALLNEPQPVTAADTDFNSIITRQEWSSAAKRRFGRLDKSADRLLQLGELPVPPVQALMQAGSAPGR